MLEKLSLPVPAAVGGMANAINLDNEAALNMDKPYKSQPMQVGPLAQVLIGCAQGHKLTLEWTGEAISRVSAISKKHVTPAVLHSTLGSIAARHSRLGPRRQTLGSAGEKYCFRRCQMYVVPQFGDKELGGVSFHEAPRGTLSHWLVLKNGRSPITTGSSRPHGTPDPGMRMARMVPMRLRLLGNPVAEPERPLEILRTVHSFDPCLASAILTFDPDGKEVISVS